MIQVYKKENLFIILDTVRDYVYPNLTAIEAQKILKLYEREEDRIEDALPFEYYLDHCFLPKEAKQVFEERQKLWNTY